MGKERCLLCSWTPRVEDRNGETFLQAGILRLENHLVCAAEYDMERQAKYEENGQKAEHATQRRTRSLANAHLGTRHRVGRRSLESRHTHTRTNARTQTPTETKTNTHTCFMDLT